MKQGKTDEIKDKVLDLSDYMTRDYSMATCGPSHSCGGGR